MSTRSKYNTKQREVLLEYARSVKGSHFNAGDVCDYLKKQGSSIGQSTVYRQLESLVDEGILNKYIIDTNSPACFEYVDENSHQDGGVCFHCKCEKCGDLIHLHCDELMEIQDHLYDEHQFKLDIKRTVFYGICEKCFRTISSFVIFAVIMAAFCLSACGPVSTTNNPENDKIQIVTTIFPEYDWVMNILGDNPSDAEVTLLLDSGVDPHSFQPAADDILKVSTCDLFIYVGGESDEWVNDALREAVNKDMVVINLLDVLGDSVREEEIVEGMQKEETDRDEHVWLSLRNASALTEAISEALQRLDAANAIVYRDNTDAYVKKLHKLDEQYIETVSQSPVKTLVFGDRFPFRYLTDDYGLTYYAAFVGCSAETEAGFDTITFLAEKIDELSLHAVMTIEGDDHRIAETIVANTAEKNQQILTLDSMQSTTLKDIENGTTYLSVMENNMSVLKDALR